jgi:hypothetical protein
MSQADKAQASVLISKEKEVDEGEQDEDEEGYEAEPVLAYSRMKNDIEKLMQNDSVSCIKAGHKVRPRPIRLV